MHDPAIPPPGGLVEEALLERFLARVAEDLAERPLDAEVGAHRAEIAERLRRAGGETHYEVLGVPESVQSEAVAAAFAVLGRRVHPSHAARLQVPEALLRLLFEHAARAYLVLSDPDRRREYDRLHRPARGAAPASEEELREARRAIARANLVRARAAMRAEKYHTVVELLRDAVRWDPQPEALALLAEAMARNPRWCDEAAERYREAIALAPREPAYRLRLAQLLEGMERREEAAEEYRQVLARMPGHPEALAALERLGGAAGGAARGR